MSAINWARLGRGVEHYKTSVNALYVEVPWWATKAAIDITRPADASAYTLDRNGKQLVASGEQSFLYQRMKGYLHPGTLYQSITPCWREEAQDALHRKHFMKLELFAFADSTTPLVEPLSRVVWAATKFFLTETRRDVHQVSVAHNGAIADTSVDLVANVEGQQYELGSYGLRCAPEVGTWLYATGCAEPRTTMAARPAPSRFPPNPGYHLAEIPRGVYGQLSKVEEELREAQDAEAQGVDLMVLLELSDLLGATAAVAERMGSSLDDLIAMMKVTKRAFEAGDRTPT